MLRKSRSYAEIYNDLDAEIVNLFRVVRDRGGELVSALELTPFSRDEFGDSYKPSADPVEQARRTIVRSFMGFGSAAACGEVSGFRADSNRSGSTPARDWRAYPRALVAVVERLRGVVIENRPAVDVVAAHDSPNTLHYVDPPYVHETRSDKVRGTVTRKAYRFEMSNKDHEEMAEILSGLKGSVVVSGYDCPLYRRLFSGWTRVERKAHADGARVRKEVLWLRGCVSVQSEMFEGGG